VFSVGEGEKVVAHQPDEVRHHDNERDDDRDIGTGGLECLARIAVDQQEHQHRRC
jgi:hypothetical protein